MPQFQKTLMEGVMLTVALWILGFVVNAVKIPFLAVPSVSAGNFIGLYVGLVAALYIKDWIQANVLKGRGLF